MSLADERLAEYAGVLTMEWGPDHAEYDIWVLMENLLWISDKDGDTVPFILNEQQCDLYAEMCRQRLGESPIRQDILKARQVGYSTFIAGYIFVRAMFTPNLKAGVVADKMENAKGLFEKYEFFYRHLDWSNPKRDEILAWEESHRGQLHPDSWKPPLESARGQTLMRTAYNSSIKVIVADDEAGRGSTNHLLHMSECAFYKDLKLTLNSLFETVSDGNRESAIFLETTANGFNEYKDHWDEDSAGDSAYRATFTPWFTNPEYADDRFSTEKGNMPRMEEWLCEKQRKHNLSDAQMAWYWFKYRTKKDRGLMLQEYPFEPMDAFLTTGSSVFDVGLTQQRKSELRGQQPRRGRFAVSARYSPDGMSVDLQSAGFVESGDGKVTIYREPVPGHSYIANLDPAMGGEDKYVVQVIDNCTLRQVAKFAQKKARDDDVAFQMAALGRYYNDACLSAETNNANGTYILQLIDKTGYRNIFMDPGYDGLTDRYQDAFGYKTSTRNKNPMITMLKIAFQDDYQMIEDPETLSEMEGFGVVRTQTGKEQMKAEGNGHDDHVMALAGCMYVREVGNVPTVPKQWSPKAGPGAFDPFGRGQRKKGFKKDSEVYQRW